ncbi:uncharacterized protein Pyn_21514 [Prunus yedoensis var. nudiflora]|uniref:Wound-responsive family protein n=1 Tax=Prunus yedoensis var. nudiflora TaxID=2094558 RepID=A0A314U873_PRUYE|nr:uncharacterized protein Pyn_21514 [Prunus yedoensis var. nudiflora]
MSSSSAATARRGWMVAASVGVVEALKDQGICRWNYTMRLMQQHAKSQLGSFSQANKLSSSSSALVSSKLRDEKVKQSEESLRQVMYLAAGDPIDFSNCLDYKFSSFEAWHDDSWKHAVKLTMVGAGCAA